MLPIDLYEIIKEGRLTLSPVSYCAGRVEKATMNGFRKRSRPPLRLEFF